MKQSLPGRQIQGRLHAGYFLASHRISLNFKRMTPRNLKNRSACLAILALAFVTSTACKPGTTLTDGVEIKGGGVTFVVVSETSTSAYGDDGIEYKGESARAKTDGKTLTVDGANYGPVAAGDKIDLRTKGKVSINGTLRTPVK